METGSKDPMDYSLSSDLPQSFLPLFGHCLRISKINAVRQTDIIGTSRHKPVIYPVMTKVAFMGDLGLLIKGNRIVGTGIQAGLTATALGVIQDHDTILSFCNCFFGTNVKARRVVAMHA